MGQTDGRDDRPSTRPRDGPRHLLRDRPAQNCAGLFCWGMGLPSACLDLWSRRSAAFGAGRVGRESARVVSAAHASSGASPSPVSHHTPEECVREGCSPNERQVDHQPGPHESPGECVVRNFQRACAPARDPRWRGRAGGRESWIRDRGRRAALERLGAPIPKPEKDRAGPAERGDACLPAHQLGPGMIDRDRSDPERRGEFS